MGAETSEAPGYEKQLDGEQQAHTRVDDVKAVKQAYGLLVYGSSPPALGAGRWQRAPQLLDCLVGVQRVLGATNEFRVSTCTITGCAAQSCSLLFFSPILSAL